MSKILNPHPGDEIKRLLREINVTQGRLAFDINESPVMIDRIIKRETALTPVIAIKIAKALGLSPEALFEMQARHDISRAMRHEKAENVRPYHTTSSVIPDRSD